MGVEGVRKGVDRHRRGTDKSGKGDTEIFQY